MAPLSPRRPGFSRRAQYGLFTGYVIAIIGVLIGILLMFSARFDPAGNAIIQSQLTDIFAPISSAGRSVVRFGKDGANHVGAYFDAASKNYAMAQELKEARRKIIVGNAATLENRRLKKMLALTENMPQPISTARLISSTGSSSRRYAVLDAGSAQGVKSGQPVRSADGLVGRIVQTGNSTSRILLIVDGGNIVPVKRLSDGIPALAIGLGDGRLELRPLAAGTNPFRAGDVFVTSGTGGIYQPNIAVCIAIKQTRDGTFARPLADPANLDFAIIDPVFIVAPPPSPNELPRSAE